MGVNGARKCVKVTLNINEVKNAKPKADSYNLTDANGLSLQISPLGTKTWHYRYWHKGLPNTVNRRANGPPDRRAKGTPSQGSHDGRGTLLALRAA